ncbi:ZIP family metal transporter [Nocardia otitidiscaviarum]|nr:ZIP family metal transporter [Nocardia otitidiscaviarum]MBF6488213.1 ZIP family metal transporter [Nocardia otitidiscaviarum]
MLSWIIVSGLAMSVLALIGAVTLILSEQRFRRLASPLVAVAAARFTAAHEIPHEPGDFGILLHSGWRPRQALTYNVASAVTFPIGDLLVYAVADHFDLAVLVAFAAGNFVYIVLADLIPEITTSPSPQVELMHTTCSERAWPCCWASLWLRNRRFVRKPDRSADPLVCPLTCRDTPARRCARYLIVGRACCNRFRPIESAGARPVAVPVPRPRRRGVEGSDRCDRG